MGEVGREIKCDGAMVRRYDDLTVCGLTDEQ
jgi:hypothetical protein